SDVASSTVGPRSVLPAWIASQTPVHFALLRREIDRRLTLATEIDGYFCDPRCPWQRGSSENTNRLLRQYLPRGTDLSLYSQAKLSAIARRLNERPRKTLLFQTPAEKFAECVAAIS